MWLKRSFLTLAALIAVLHTVVAHDHHVAQEEDHHHHVKSEILNVIADFFHLSSEEGQLEDVFPGTVQPPVFHVMICESFHLPQITLVAQELNMLLTPALCDPLPICDGYEQAFQNRPPPFLS